MDKQQHILRAYDTALEQYSKQVLQLFGRALGALEDSCRALAGRDVSLAGRVVAEDDGLDALYRDINAAGMSILAAFHPVSVDLKYVLALMKLAGVFERLGDYAAKVATHCLRLDKLGWSGSVDAVVPVFDAMLRQLRVICGAFESGDREVVREYLVIHEGRERFVASLTERLTAESESEGVAIPALAELIFISRTLEYVWDYLYKIEEEVLSLPCN